MPATQFALLGPLRVSSGGTVVAVSPGKQRAVLAALLLRANQVVSVDELAEVLWGPDPPAAARVSVQNYVMRLRKSLRDAAADIGTRPGGYLISISRDGLDVAAFEEHVRAAHSAARTGDWPAATEQARAALTLWRGEPLTDVSSEILLAREGPRLAELRQQAVEIGLGADVRFGRHAEAIADLQRLTSEHPLRENLHGLLMLALYRDGRQGEALTAYLQVRQLLITELGTEPGPDLQRLHQQILEGDPALDPPEPAAVSGARAANPPGGRPAVVPRELPAPVGHFTGRAAELASLTSLIDASGKPPGDGPPTTLLISAIGGTAGVGKTALAVHWGHQVADRFPDGQLYVNLRGYDPEQPVAAADALAGFLRSLGVAGQDIPAEADERAARYRSLLAGKRIAVVLDNASSVEQVRPLLPGSPDCAVVVTSRDALAGLVARDGATRVDLDLLPRDDAIGLLSKLIGRRAESDPVTTAMLAERCARLPLALRVAAELAATRPAAPLADLVDELADLQGRLDLLDAGGDPRTAVRAVFSWSYRNLHADAAGAFRHVGLHPGPDFEPYAVAALAGTSLSQARRDLDALTRAYLIQRSGPGRYTMHDLLRAYARDLASSQESGAQREALSRLFDHYLAAAAAAVNNMYPGERSDRPTVPALATTPALTDSGASLAWLDAERTVLSAAAAHAAENGWPTHAVGLSSILFRYLDTGAHFAEAATIHSHACSAARELGDRAAEASALNFLAGIDWRQSRYEQAASRLAEARELYRQADDNFGEARVLANIAQLEYGRSSYQRAEELLLQALELDRRNGNKFHTAITLSTLGNTYERIGSYVRAQAHHQQALALFSEAGQPAGEGMALANLAVIAEHWGQFDQAVTRNQQAMDKCAQIGDRLGHAIVLQNLGNIDLRQRRLDRAVARFREALARYREIGEVANEAELHNDLGNALLAQGLPDQARAEHVASLSLASHIGLRHEQARAHDGLGRCCHAVGKSDQSRDHWQQALALYTELGIPGADEVRERLTSLEYETGTSRGSRNDPPTAPAGI